MQGSILHRWTQAHFKGSQVGRLRPGGLSILGPGKKAVFALKMTELVELRDASTFEGDPRLFLSSAQQESYNFLDRI